MLNNPKGLQLAVAKKDYRLAFALVDANADEKWFRCGSPHAGPALQIVILSNNLGLIEHVWQIFQEKEYNVSRDFRENVVRPMFRDVFGHGHLETLKWMIKNLDSNYIPGWDPYISMRSMSVPFFSWAVDKWSLYPHIYTRETFGSPCVGWFERACEAGRWDLAEVMYHYDQTYGRKGLYFDNSSPDFVKWCVLNVSKVNPDNSSE